MKQKSNVRVLRDLGQLIHDERVAEGLTQQELSEKAGLSRYYVSSIESGKKNMSISVFRDIASVLEVPSWRWLRQAETDTDKAA